MAKRLIETLGLPIALAHHQIEFPHTVRPEPGFSGLFHSAPKAISISATPNCAPLLTRQQFS